MTVILPVLLLVTLMEPPPSAAFSNTLPPSDEASAEPPAIPAAFRWMQRSPNPGTRRSCHPEIPVSRTLPNRKKAFSGLNLHRRTWTTRMVPALIRGLR